MNDKVVIVTGGSRGIGKAVVTELAENGYRTALVYNNSEAEALAVADGLKSRGFVCEAFKCNITSSAQVKSCVCDILNRFGDVFALVNCAGVAQQKLFTDITDEDWHNMIETDLSGTFYFCREVLGRMISNKCGKIVNIASMWGETGASLEVHYSAAKAGVIGLTKALAKEVGLSDITVNCVSPGVIMTDMMSSFTQADVDALKEETPLYKLGNPSDVSGAVSFLLSESADFITGQVLSVNGGFVI